jgi:hypothetical protein
MIDGVDIEVRGQHLPELHDVEAVVDRWLTDLVDDTVDYAAARLHEHAPGKITDLVGSEGAQFDPHIGFIEGEAFVLPDIQEEIDHPRGLGSSPADYPFYVDVGTGVYGEHGTPITSLPGHVMGPVEWGGRMIYIKFDKGQRPQHYSDAAHKDTDVWLPGKIQEAKSKLKI